MLDLKKINNPYNEDKVIAACSIFGMMDTSGNCFSGRDIITAIGNMNVRGNGLGGGFAVYGIYPDYADKYAFHIMYDRGIGKEETEDFLKSKFYLVHEEQVPTRPCSAVKNPPLVWRYFLDIHGDNCPEGPMDDYIVDRVMEINTGINGAYVFSSGKNMGVFKGVGYPEDIADYFMLENYNGYLWSAHGRFPTNTRAWWGGAHPFNILDWTVVHNGEISSYGINRRYLEQYGYNCTLETDTEVIAYAVDLLTRKHNLPMEIVAKIFAPPFWDRIARMPENERELMMALRQTYGSLLMNGPFTVIIAHQGEMVGLTDRIRLRPLTVGTRDSMVYLSSEESAIRLVSPELDDAWIPLGGEPVIARLGSLPQSRHSTGRVANIAKVK
jgi:glutamate synthase domain-containing protein 1